MPDERNVDAVDVDAVWDRDPEWSELCAKAAERGARVVFPECQLDARVSSAVAALEGRGLCRPVPLACEIGTPAHLGALARVRATPEALARRMLSKPLVRAAAMVAAGEADAMVAGALAPTRRVIEAAALAIGLAPGISVPSSFFLMRLADGGRLVFADCAVNVAPDAEGLAAIARASVNSARRLLGQARPAFLSFSTGTSGAGESVNRVRAAARQTGYPGPVQADAALNPAIAAQKGVAMHEGQSAQPANVLIFPDLDSGNIAYKLMRELAGAQAIGPCLQGFARPVCDLSRGASPTDIVAATVVTLALA